MIEGKDGRTVNVGKYLRYSESISPLRLPVVCDVGFIRAMIEVGEWRVETGFQIKEGGEVTLEGDGGLVL